MNNLYGFKFVRLTVQCFDKLENVKYTQKPKIQNIFQYIMGSFNEGLYTFSFLF
jgi:hypothetical protein